MKKICMLCCTTFENEKIKYCPHCNFLSKDLRILMDYDKYEAYLTELQNPNSATRREYIETMSQFSNMGNPSLDLVNALDSESAEKRRLAKILLQIQAENNNPPQYANQQQYTNTPQYANPPQYANAPQYANTPKCPTCGTTNIRHISSTERGVNTIMFGFFGNKRKCQFECLNPNCRYRW